MASYHFAMKTSNNCAAPANIHFDYIAREGKYSQGKKAEEMIHKGNGNIPAWANSPSEFWEASQVYEVGRTSYREIELALPNELTQDEQIALTKQFIDTHLGNHFAYSYAIHCNDARLSSRVEVSYKDVDDVSIPAIVPQKNPHVHIMFCERRLDGIERDRSNFFKRANSTNPELGGAVKDRCWNGANRVQHLRSLRESWSLMQNKALEAAGFSHVKVDHRSLRVQHEEAVEKGDLDKAKLLDRMPETHLGPKVTALKSENMNQEQQEKLNVVHSSREYRDIHEKWSSLREQLRQSNSSQSDIDLSVKEIRGICDSRIKELNQEYEKLRQVHSSLLKSIISPERAELIAEGIYFRGEPKRLREETRKIDKIRQRYSERLHDFKNMPKPGMFQFEAKKAYEAEKSKLNSMENEIKTRTDLLDSQMKVYIEKRSSASARLAIQKLKEKVLLRNDSGTNKRIAEVKASMTKIQSEKEQVLSLRREMGTAYDKDQVRVRAPLRNEQNSGTPIEPKTLSQNLTAQSAHIISQLKRLNGNDRGVSFTAHIPEDEAERSRKMRMQ